MLDAAISPDGRTLAAAAGSLGPDGDPVSYLQVWDLPQRRLAHYVESPVLNLTSVAFSADGRTLVTQAGVPFDGPGDLTAVVWDTGTWQPRGEPWRLIDGYPDDHVVFLSRDGKLLTAPDGDGATVWDVATRTPRRHIVVTDDDALSALALSSDGSTVALGLESGKVRTVDTTTGATLLDVVADRDVAPTSIEFSPDDAMLAVANRGGRTQLFDVAIRRRPRTAAGGQRRGGERRELQRRRPPPGHRRARSHRRHLAPRRQPFDRRARTPTTSRSPPRSSSRPTGATC